MSEPLMKRAVRVALDPGRHLSLEAGDAIALFFLGGLIGIIFATIMNPRVMCWFG